MNLTEKQKAFADYYVETLNATEAALKAGYSENTAGAIGHENLNKPKIRKYMKAMMEDKENERIASQNEVLEYLTETMRNNTEQTKERTKAANLLGKRYALFTDVVENKGEVNIKVTIEDE